jgi:hypothetical protein
MHANFFHDSSNHHVCPKMSKIFYENVHDNNDNSMHEIGSSSVRRVDSCTLDFVAHSEHGEENVGAHLEMVNVDSLEEKEQGEKSLNESDPHFEHEDLESYHEQY